MATIKKKAKAPKPKKGVNQAPPSVQEPPPPKLPRVIWDVQATRHKYVTGEMYIWMGKCEWEGKQQVYHLVRSPSKGAAAFSAEYQRPSFGKNTMFDALEKGQEGNYPKYWHLLETALEKCEAHLCTYLGVEAVVSNRDELLAEAKRTGLDQPPVPVNITKEQDAQVTNGKGEASSSGGGAPRRTRAKNGQTLGSQDETKAMAWFKANPEVRVRMAELQAKAGLRDTLYCFCKKQFEEGVLAKDGKAYYYPGEKTEAPKAKKKK